MDTKRIYFNIGHVALIIIMLIFFFFVYVFNDAVEKREPEVAVISKMSSEKEYQKMNINDTYAFVNTVKETLKDRINVVSKPQVLSQSKDTIKIQIDNYIVEAKLNDYELDQKTEITLMVHQGSHTLVEEIVVPIEFVDTQAPTIILNTDNVQLYEDEVFDASDYIETISDNYDVDINYQIVNEIPIENNHLKIGNYDVIYECVDTSNNRTEVKLHVEIKEKEKTTPIMSNTANIMMTSLHKQALDLVGKPYVWGGKGPDVFDCSGVIMYLYKLNGIDLQWSDIQYGNGVNISLDSSKWQVGDVLSYVDSSGEVVHHALYLGNHMALHAITSGVNIIDIDTPLIGVDGSYEILSRVTRYNNLFIK